MSPSPPSLSLPLRKRLRFSISEELERELLRELKKEKTTPPTTDEDDLFGQSIVATLKKLPAQQKGLAKVKMQQVLYDIQFCNAYPNT